MSKIWLKLYLIQGGMLGPFDVDYEEGSKLVDQWRNNEVAEVKIQQPGDNGTIFLRTEHITAIDFRYENTFPTPSPMPPTAKFLG